MFTVICIDYSDILYEWLSIISCAIVQFTILTFWQTLQIQRTKVRISVMKLGQLSIKMISGQGAKSAKDNKCAVLGEVVSKSHPTFLWSKHKSIGIKIYRTYSTQSKCTHYIECLVSQVCIKCIISNEHIYKLPNTVKMTENYNSPVK